MSFDLRTFPNDTALAAAAASDWLLELQSAAGRTTKLPYTVALSGGRIARTFYQETTRQIEANPAAFKDVFARTHFFWADERCVPPTDPESNFGVARDLLFEPLKIPSSQIHRVRGEEPEPVALREALREISSVAAVSHGQPALDLVFLGMGEDGHVASLFPEEPETMAHDPAIYRAVTAVKPPPRRITLGYGPIWVATRVWVLVSGAGKEEALRKSLSPMGKTPLARVVEGRGGMRIYSDVAPR
jgi:6-phosphogluconolactonase